MSLKSYGAAREVTGSCHLIEIGGRKILIDCGMFQGHRKEAERKNRGPIDDPSSIDAVILTHAHCDHSCRLPVLVASGFTGNIYTTSATRDLANLIMADSAYIQSKDAEWLRKKNPKHPFKPLFEIGDVLKTLDHFVTVGYNRSINVADGVTATFLNAGHILGSAMVVLEGRDGARVAFTGDLGRDGLAIIDDPAQLPPVDYLVCEATYGNRVHDPIDNACRQLAAVIKDTVDRGGKLIIPAFAVERTQDIIYYLHLLLLERKIPAIDVFVDSPMAINATSIFRIHQECYEHKIREDFIAKRMDPFGFDSLRYIIDPEESMALNDRREPCIIISSSGMCEAGRILHHLKNNIENPRNTVLIVGYMAENTLGRKLVDRLPEVGIFGKPYQLNAEVKVLNTFSAHADYRDIEKLVSGLDQKRLRGVFLVHGEDDALAALKARLLAAGVSGVSVVEPSVEYAMPV